MNRSETSSRIARWMRRIPTALFILLAFLLGLAIRAGLRPADSDDATPGALEMQARGHAMDGGTEAPSAAVSEEVYWTCAMHPQIRSDEAGRCPLCGMDLVPARVTVGGGLRTLAMSPEARALLDVRTAPVERRFVAADVRMTGKLDFDETRLGYITAWVPGRLDRLYVDFTGVQVEEGEHMVYLYSPEILAAQEELIQALKGARELAETDVSALRGSARQTLESARERLRLWGLTTEQVRAIEERGTPSDHITIYAPMGGIVIEKHAQQGMYVDTGTRIYTIADLSRLWLRLDAYESDLSWIRFGQTVEFSVDAWPGETFRGTISFIHPVIDERTRTVKVRVNVPNPDGRLKPEMLAHAIVHSRIAAGGRVMDPDLEGKWICPMHPDVVRAEPGDCDVCGMGLRTPESLGFVAAPEEDAVPPLVIPKSAALRTGERAVVYVEVSGEERPTFEGREILLGPRAGEFYLVRNGLAEGERVVVQGNFAIDSALQIEAKPSMMAPLGGGGGGAHDHGGREEHAGGEEAPGRTTELSPEALEGLRALERAVDDVARAVASEDLSRARSGFEELGRLLESTSAELFEAHAAMVWSEASMQLSNDAVEGTTARDLAQVRRIHEGAVDTLAWAREQTGLPPSEMLRPGPIPPPAEAPRAHAVPPDELPEDLREQLTTFWGSYAELHDALVEDEAERARSAAARVAEAASSGAWEDAFPGLVRAAGALDEATAPLALRTAFAALSAEFGDVLRARSTALREPVHRIRCPMALDGRGADWLQASPAVRNPYLDPSMRRCGSVVETIGEETRDDE